MESGRKPPTALDSFEHALADARRTESTLARKVQIHALLAGADAIAPSLADPRARFDLAMPRIDRYVLERKVGAGGMGVVFRGHAGDDPTPVAIKVLAREAQFEHARFAREVELLRGLASPGVVRYLDHGTTADGLDYLVTEWLDGEDLSERLRRGPLAVRDALQVALGIASALVAVHAAGVIHRDIKPANVMLLGPGVDELRVIDLGIARAIERAQHFTATGAFIGTPSYMAPEQIRGQSETRSDIYGLGATLFEALSGRPPFLGSHPGAIILSVLGEAPPSLSALRPEIPGAVDAVVGRMLAKDPDDRPIDMAAVMTELAQLVARITNRTDRPVVLSRAERTLRTPSDACPVVDTLGVLGRQRVFGQLEGLLAELHEEQSAALISITGGQGAGKSAVMDELERRATGWRCVHARAHREHIGVPFAVARALVASSAGDMRLLELFNPSRPDIDPIVWGDRLIAAWLDQIEVWLDDGPLLILVDDADKADLSSLRLLDRSLAQLNQHAFAVVVSQSSASCAELGALLPDAMHARITLTPIAERAALALVTRWAPHASSSARARLVSIGAGNPAHLRELCRSLDHHDQLDSHSAAELLWARVAALDPELRRTLRAASLVGRELWPAAVAELLGTSRDDSGLARRLAAAVSGGYLRPARSSRVPGEQQFEFTSELAFLAFYELTNHADRRAGHRSVADWLVAHAPHDLAGRARHLDAAGDRPQAARYHLAAARAALAGGDRRGFEHALARAMADEAPPGIAAEAAALLATALLWRGATREAVEASEAALRKLARGTRAWFDAASTAITAAGQLGDHAALRASATQVVQTLASCPDAAQARIVAASRALCQMVVTHDDLDSQAALDVIAQSLPLAALGPEARAWQHRVESARAAPLGADSAVNAIVAAHRAHLEDGDLRSAALMGVHLCSYQVWSGAWERAREAIDDALRIARRLSVDYLVLWGSYAEAKLLVETAIYPEARQALEHVIAGATASPRIRAGALIYASVAATREREYRHAITCARAARATHGAPAIVLAAIAAEVRPLLALGERDRAESIAAELAPHANARSRLVEFDELVRLAWAELALARGDARTSQALENAVAVIVARADTLTCPLRRNQYLARPHVVAATLALARSAAAGANTPVSDESF